jgi:hypothetical protein
VVPEGSGWLSEKFGLMFAVEKCPTLNNAMSVVSSGFPLAECVCSVALSIYIAKQLLLESFISFIASDLT